MIDTLSTVTSTTVAVALDALSLRQQLIAANLANANSTTYNAQRIDFEEVLRRELERSDPTEKMQTVADLRELRTAVNAGDFITESPAAGIEIDQQMIQLNETVIRYQALIQGMGKYGSLARMAISGEVKP
jgi:flagellar basal-body rod protein FlgB